MLVDPGIWTTDTKLSLQTPQPNVSCYVITSWFSTPFIVYTSNRGAVIWLELYMRVKFFFAQWLQSKQSCFKLKTVDMVRGLIGRPHTIPPVVVPRHSTPHPIIEASDLQ